MGDIFLVTGPPGVGKSTLVSRAVMRLKSKGFIVGGCVTAERRRQGKRVGFEVRDLTSGGQAEFASLEGGLGPRVGKYRVDLTKLAVVGAKGLIGAASSAELIVIDEVGPMELVSPEFRRAVRACIDSGRPILAVVHETMEDDLLVELRAAAKETFTVDTLNREGLVDDLGKALYEALSRPKPS